MVSYADAHILDLTDEIDRRGLTVSNPNPTQEDYIRTLEEDDSLQDNLGLSSDRVEDLTIPELKTLFDAEGIPDSELYNKGEYLERYRQAREDVLQTQEQLQQKGVDFQQYLQTLVMPRLRDIASNKGISLPRSASKETLIQAILQST